MGVEDLNSESGVLYDLFQSIFPATRGCHASEKEGCSDTAEYSNTTLEMKKAELLSTKA